MPEKKTQDINIQNIDPGLLYSLVEENENMRRLLLEVSAVGTSMMFHTHRYDCSSFTRDFLKSIVSLAHQIDAKRIETIYKDAYDFASEPSVIHQLGLNIKEKA